MLDGDGNPLLMSYWFATLKAFYIQHHKSEKIIWALVNWFYQCDDLINHHDVLSHSLANNEVVNSNHLSIIDVHCIESPQPIYRLPSPTSALPLTMPFVCYDINVEFKKKRSHAVNTPLCITLRNSSEI
ncbi:hypothetical protein EDC04DRAFT_2889800 [Pisolithus marmoratus]|nr:hypothetical protein EDC04DRAFT_2889800 [Pisolithus marmoratus]